MVKFYIQFLISFFFCSFSFAQLEINDIKFYKADKEKNITLHKLYSDQNASAYIILIRKYVKKHQHAYHTETVTVLEGRGIMSLDSSSFKIHKNDIIIIPPGTAHAVMTLGRKPLKVLSVQAPEFKGKDRIFIEDN